VGIDDPNTIGADHPDSSLLGKTPEFFLLSPARFSHLGISRTEKNDERNPFLGTLLECFQHQLSRNPDQGQVHGLRNSCESGKTRESGNLLVFWVYWKNFTGIPMVVQKSDREPSNARKIIGSADNGYGTGIE
jgi:hypothetical protein